MRSGPKTPIGCRHLPHQPDRLGREPWLARARLGCVLPDRAEELTRPSQKRLRLNKDKCLLPGANHAGHNDQEKPIGLAVCRSVDLARHHGRWRRSRVFCASSWAFPLVRAASMPSTREVAGGLSQREARSWNV